VALLLAQPDAAVYAARYPISYHRNTIPLRVTAPTIPAMPLFLAESPIEASDGPNEIAKLA
jgi:hypothetical protein